MKHEYWINYTEVDRVAGYMKFNKSVSKKNIQLCCNCIEVNKEYKEPITEYMMYNLTRGNTFKTKTNNGICIYCRHYAFYSEINLEGRGIEK